jgi:hypothetical protein
MALTKEELFEKIEEVFNSFKTDDEKLLEIKNLILFN